ncbi:glycosyl transferase [Niallia circulans]|uniref:glycosyltransferase family 2 protein n=1 Tax=Niallia circulans TaxID=1397 RepID=UPI00201D7A84|nr:glycosyltransferase family 2 protein [Niallia circulans]UQZ76070.1 glycosyl transferase [Niallia circulans]
MNPLVSIVLLSWNRKDDVIESLTRIQEINYDSLEIIVVDNGSTDGTQEMVERDFPHVHLLRMYKNVGIEAYNIGFENARGEFIVIIDDDSFPEQNSIQRMVDRFNEDPELGVVAFDVRNFYQYDDMRRDNIVESTTKIDSNQYIMSFNGAGAGVRKSVFKQAGYYPEEFFLYHNELDVAYRIWNNGYKIQSFSDIISYHKYSPVNRSSWRAPFYYTRNAFWIMWKNYPIKIAIRETLFFLQKCIFYSLEQSTTIYLKAFLSAIFGINQIKDKRIPIKKEIVHKMRASLDLAFTFYR